MPLSNKTKQKLTLLLTHSRARQQALEMGPEGTFDEMISAPDNVECVEMFGEEDMRSVRRTNQELLDNKEETLQLITKLLEEGDDRSSKKPLASW